MKSCFIDIPLWGYFFLPMALVAQPLVLLLKIHGCEISNREVSEWYLLLSKALNFPVRFQ